MTQAEQVLSFTCAGEQLLGVLSPAAEAADTGVLIIVGGPQYRAGSHRQFVQLARAVAAAGFPALRFDYRGMGDSQGTLHDFEAVSADIGVAISALLAAQPTVRRVVLWGLCDGASAALLYLHDQADPRVAGLVLLNPWVRSEASLAKTHVKHYYLQRLKEPAFWRKLASGRVAFGALSGLLGNLRAAFGDASHNSDPAAVAGYQERMAKAWAAFQGPTLLLLSESDHTAREFIEYTASSTPWQAALKQRPPTRVSLRGADHTCSTAATKRAMEATTTQWLATLGPSGA